MVVVGCLYKYKCRVAGECSDRHVCNIYNILLLPFFSINKAFFTNNFTFFISFQSEDGMTCLHLAAKAGHLETVTYLIESGKIDVNLQDEGGWTSLIWATEYKHLNVVQFLINKGANANIIDVVSCCLCWHSFWKEVALGCMTSLNLRFVTKTSLSHPETIISKLLGGEKGKKCFQLSHGFKPFDWEIACMDQKSTRGDHWFSCSFSFYSWFSKRNRRFDFEHKIVHHFIWFSSLLVSHCVFLSMLPFLF